MHCCGELKRRLMILKENIVDYNIIKMISNFLVKIEQMYYP